MTKQSIGLAARVAALCLIVGIVLSHRIEPPRPGKIEENNIVHGRLYRCAERWQERPAIILLDGNPPVGYYSAFPLLARRCNRAGFNVATLVAPYELQRRPLRAFEWDCMEFAWTIAQNWIRPG